MGQIYSDEIRERRVRIQPTLTSRVVDRPTPAGRTSTKQPFNDSIRRPRAETVWEKIKAATSKHGVGLSIELIKALAAEYGAKVLGLKA